MICGANEHLERLLTEIASHPYAPVEKISLAKRTLLVDEVEESLILDFHGDVLRGFLPCLVAGDAPERDIDLVQLLV